MAHPDTGPAARAPISTPHAGALPPSRGQSRRLRWWAAPAAWLAGMLMVVASIVAPVWAADAAPPASPVPAAAFFRPPAMWQPVLSPNGQRLAVHVAAPDGRIRLAVMAVAPPRQARIVASFPEADVTEVQWVNDDRLVFRITDQLAAWSDRKGGGLFAVNADGGDQRVLIRTQWRHADPSSVANRELLPDHVLQRVLRDGSPDVVVAQYVFDERYEFKNLRLYRLNTVTGIARAIDADLPRLVSQWHVDDQGVPRVATVVQGPRTDVMWRPAADVPWAAIGGGETYGGRSMLPLPIGADGVLYASVHNGDSGLLQRFDPNARALQAEPLLAIKGFDFRGGLVFDARRRQLIGVHYLGDGRGTVWFDPALQKLQMRLDERLPGRINLLQPAECGCARTLVVTSYSDRQPQQYYLYDTEADALALIGALRPAIDPKRMAERDFVRIATRDGRQMPVHVTRPAGKGPWPTVVLVHGGPFVRGGEWAWDADSQFLASRGYLVVEPEFRGSTGYGWSHFRAGWQQWGLAMQDDIADATRWAVAQGQADATRVCIAGASYGGYATLMGLVRDPDLYRCGVAWVAVTDLRLMYDISYSDLPEIFREHGMPLLIGDRERDAERLAATSPLAQAERITRPLMLVHGSRDRRVPIAHALKLRDALMALKRPPEWHDYADEGHGFFNPDNRIDFMQRMERFLAQHLAPQ